MNGTQGNSRDLPESPHHSLCQGCTNALCTNAPSAKDVCAPSTRYPPLCRLLRNRCTAAISADNAILDRHDDTGMAVLCFVNGRGRARAQTDASQSVSQLFHGPAPPNQSQNHLTERYGTSGFARCGPLGFHPRAHFIFPSSLHVRRFKNTVGEPGRSTVTTGTAEG